LITTNLYGRKPKSKCYSRLIDRFVGVSFPSISPLYRGVNKFESTSLAKKKLQRKGDYVRACSETNTRRSWKWLYPESGVTKPSAYASTEFLLSKLYKFTVVRKLQEADCVARVRLCNWYCETVCSGESWTIG